MKNTYLIDTNILVYAYNVNSSFHEISIKIINAALNGEFNASIADKNLFELFAVITDKKRVEKPLNSSEAANIVSFLFNSGIPIIYSTPETINKTMELTKKHRISKQDIFDTVLVSMMVENKIATIISYNEKHFKIFKEITVLNPQKDKMPEF